MHRLLPAILFLASHAAPPQLPAGELTSFLKVISASAGAPGRIACRDLDLSMELKKSGLSPDAKAPVAWAANENQLKAFLAEGKLVVSGDARMLDQGAGIAIIKNKAGKAEIHVNAKNVAASGITLSDALLKISKVD